MKNRLLKTLIMKPMNFSKHSKDFSQDFINLLDDMLTDSTSMAETDFVDDLLDLISERLVSLHDYYNSSLASVQYYQRQIMERKVKSPVQQDNYQDVVKFLNSNTEVAPDDC
jgi:hypothetical protein